MMLHQAIEQVMQGASLTRAESCAATLALVSPHLKAEQAIAYLTALHAKGETAAEILGVIDALQMSMLTVPMAHRVLDIVGTGGDGAHSINVSTGAAIVAASCGVCVVKHGNRAVSSLSGSADVLEALGINIAMPASQIVECLEQLNIAFCFAPNFHPALAQMRDIRRSIGRPTVFNLVGPFLNPARAQHYVMGVRTPQLLAPFAEILGQLTSHRSVVVHGNGLDEINCGGVTQVISIDGNRQTEYSLDAQQFGFMPQQPDALRGGNAQHNAELLTAALCGEQPAIADAFVLNAAVAIQIYGLVENLSDAITMARESVASGASFALLQRWQDFCGDDI